MNDISYTAIIVDDEPLAADIIKSYLKEYKNINIIGEVADGFEAVKLINSLNPQLLFLDIQMPKLNGFEVLELIETKPAIIFSTAYDEYAIKAFEVNAADYLLKPYSLERFKVAIEKAIQKIDASGNQLDVPNITEKFSSEYLDRIVIKNKSEIIVISSTEVEYIEAQDDYVMIHSGKGKFLKQKTMKFYEANLDNSEFVRIHRSYIANLSYVKKIEALEKEQYSLTLKSNTKIPVSKSGYKKIKEML